jgi:tight adherence protein C
VSPALVLVVVAGVVASAAVVDLAALAGARASRRRGPGPGRRAVLALVALGRRAGLPLRPPADLAARLAAAGTGDGGPTDGDRPNGGAAAWAKVSPRGEDPAVRGGPQPSGSARRTAFAGSARRTAFAGSDPLGDLMALKTGAALVAGLLVVPAAGAAPGRMWVVVVPGLPAAAFLAPDLWLARRARRRAAALAAEAPEVLDLVRIAVAAGMPALRAFGEVGRRHRGVLAAELATASARAALGEPVGRTLARLRARCPAPAVRALVAAVERSRRHGAPLAPALAAIAADARAERARRVQDRAARAAPKIQLVVALLLVPAVLLLVAAALVGSML